MCWCTRCSYWAHSESSGWHSPDKGRFTHSMPFPCRAVSLRFRMCLSHLIYTVRLRLIHTCHAMLRPCNSSQGHSTARLCCTVALRRTTYSERGMASVNQTWLHCVNQMRKIYSKPLAARHGRGMAWERHAICESALIMPICASSKRNARRSLVASVHNLLQQYIL